MKRIIGYEKFYDDYDKGTWFITGIDEEHYLDDRVIVDGLTIKQADDILDLLQDLMERIAILEDR